MIAKHVHAIWIAVAGLPAVPADVARNVAAWRTHHPSYSLTIWDACGVENACAEIDAHHDVHLVELLPRCRFPAMVSDIGRLAILYTQGGFYSDLKNLPLMPFLDPLTEQDRVIVPEHAPTVDDFEGRLMNSFLGAPLGHPFLLECLVEIEHRITRRAGDDVKLVTGEGPLRDVLERHRRCGVDDVELVPSQEVWGARGGTPAGWMKRTSASYNGPDMRNHWSRRQEIESIYAEPI